MLLTISHSLFLQKLVADVRRTGVDDPDLATGHAVHFLRPDLLLSSSSVHDGVTGSAILLINVVGRPIRRSGRDGVVSRSMSDDEAAAVVEGGSSAVRLLR